MAFSTTNSSLSSITKGNTYIEEARVSGNGTERSRPLTAHIAQGHKEEEGVDNNGSTRFVAEDQRMRKLGFKGKH